MTSTGAATLADLASVLQPGELVTDPDVLATHSRDQAQFSAIGNAIALVRPQSTEAVVAVLKVASLYGVPVVPQGGRTGLAGGANAVDGCILLGLERMDKIIAINPGERIAVVQPGVVNAVLSRAVEARGMLYPPDPASWESSTMGGNVATNAGGLCCVKYGVTGDYVRALQVVLADGSVLRTGRSTAKGVAGYDLTKLFVGSEGTLGVITEITVALRPTPPPVDTALAIFADAVDACEAVNDYLAGGAQPSMLELMDGPTLSIVQRYRDLGLTGEIGAMLIVQSDEEHGDEVLAEFSRICRNRGAQDVVVAEDPADAKLLTEARRLVGPAHEALGTELVDDVCVPRCRLADLIRGIAEIARQHDVLVTCAGHAGDGNMHPSVVFDASDAAVVYRARAAFEAIMRLGLDLGGTITGEHGVGLLKREWLGAEIGATGMQTHLAIKNALDPARILNPGKVIEPS